MPKTEKPKRKRGSTSDLAYIDASIIEKGHKVPRNRPQWLATQINLTRLAGFLKRLGPLGEELSARQLARLIRLPRADGKGFVQVDQLRAYRARVAPKVVVSKRRGQSADTAPG